MNANISKTLAKRISIIPVKEKCLFVSESGKY